MTKCNKCYHRAICIDGANYRNAENCKQYRNEENLVELPCNIGDVLFEICGYDIYEMRVKRMIFEDDGDVEILCSDIEIESYGNSHEKSFYNSDIGKTVFLTYEEAVKALKEREGNEKT